MKLSIGVGLLALGWLTTSGAQAQSQEDPVLDLMVRKGLVTQAEADAARAEEKKNEEETPASKIFLQTPSIQKLVFYGDGRLRFENIDQKNHYAAFTLTDRERYRLRFGADYYYSDNFKGGLNLSRRVLAIQRTRPWEAVLPRLASRRKDIFAV